jgi:PAS domain S-box-containing protein
MERIAISPHARRAVVVGVLTGVIGLALFAAHVALGLDAGLSRDFFQGLYVAVYLVAAGVLITQGLLIKSERATWMLLGIGALGSVGGWAYYFLALQDLEAPPYPSLSDALWLSFYLLGLVGLVLLARGHVSQLGRAIFVDTLLGALTLAAIAVALLLDPILASTGGSTASVATNLAYPLLDVLVVSLVLLVFAASGWRPGRRWWVIGGAWSLQAVVDTIYLYQAAGGDYSPGTLLDVPWVAVVLVLALAASLPSQARGRGELSNWARLVVPCFFAVVALVLTTLDSFYEVNNVAVILATGALLLAGVRTALTFADMRSEAHSRALQARYELILNSAGEGIYGLDREGRATFVNAAAGEMTGHEPEDVIGRRQHELVHHTRADGTPYPVEECPVMRSISAGAVSRMRQDLYWRKDGTSFPVEYTSTPIVEDGEVTGAVVVFKDISERLEVDRMKEEFTSVVSHELRTPLTSIRGSLGLLAGGTFGELPARGQRMAEIAVENTDRLVRLINDILDIERIDSGKVKLESAGCEASELVSRAIELMGQMASDAEIELTSSAESVPLEADPDRVLQTLTNLLSNAIKFSHRGGTVRLSCERQRGEALFAVHDKGRGIPAGKLDSIFERFQQVDASDSREKGGTGLGLPICRSIVQQHGGRIWVESELGRGSDFYFTLPAAVEPERPAAPVSRMPTVLVCDDDPQVLDVVSAMVEDRGYRALQAASGQEAVELAAASHPDVILLDLMMPGMNGWQTASALRERAGAEGVPIVILSVLAEAETAYPDGQVVDWLEKPLGGNALFAALEKALHRDNPFSRVLVVEDDRDLASVLRAMFERHGLETFHAETGKAAIELSQRVAPDLLVLDVGLEESDGFEVVAWLRSHERLHVVPLLVYTAKDLDHDERERLMLGGRTEFMTKSRVAPDQLEQRVMRLLREIANDGREARNGAQAPAHRG